MRVRRREARGWVPLTFRPDSTPDRYSAVAAAAGEERTAQELLPQCWAQLDHKYPERRVLVADSCGLLAPLVHAGLRGSLMLSILQQV